MRRSLTVTGLGLQAKTRRQTELYQRWDEMSFLTLQGCVNVEFQHKLQTKTKTKSKETRSSSKCECIYLVAPAAGNFSSRKGNEHANLICVTLSTPDNSSHENVREGRTSLSEAANASALPLRSQQSLWGRENGLSAQRKTTMSLV